MSDIFSHPSEAAAGEAEPRTELLFSVDVPASVDHAWAGLKEHLHLWWPADLLSRWGESSFFDLEDNALVETSADDDENVWGEVVDGLPGEWLELRWREVGSTSSTLVRFDVSPAEDADPAGSPDRGRLGVKGQAKLGVTHRGWTAVDPDDDYAFYTDFWPAALGRYQRFMGGK